jgi:CheY-like chemotaxis protein
MKKVLLVDDDELILSFLKAHFESRDFQVSLAKNGDAAISRAQKEAPDLILLDMEMPVMPGWVTARELKMRGSVTAGIPIIAVTAHTTPDDEEATRNAGCDDFIANPIDVDQLFEAVDRVLK